MLKEFKEFLMRGNLVELAVAVVMALAFAAVVSALVSGLITPIIAAIFGEPSFASMTFTINDAEFLYGAFLDAVITFVLTAAAVFFFVVKPVNAILARSRPPADEAPPTRACPECLSTISADARRCAYCTVVLVSP